MNTDLIPEITERKSIRAFSSESIDLNQIKHLIEAAGKAPSSMNEQPWRYLIGHKESNKEVFDKILSILHPTNQVWAKNAPVLVLSVVNKFFKRNNQPNRHALYDTGAANVLLSVQATHEGLQVHQMGGFDYALATKLFSLGEEFDIATVLAVGKPGNIEILPEELQKREKTISQRLQVEELIIK